MGFLKVIPKLNACLFKFQVTALKKFHKINTKKTLKCWKYTTLGVWGSKGSK